MRAPARHPEPHFSQPVRQITLMLVVLGLVVAGGWFAYAQIYPIFHINPLLNGAIAAVFSFGVAACFWQVWQLVSAVVWIENYAADRPGRPQYRAPLLLAPLAALLGARGATRRIATSASRSILESVGTRIEEARDVTRYLTSLLIFLGLLGTFYGLATTVPGVVDTIRALAPKNGEGASEVFERLMTGLESQLGGMGTAFSSSLIGLAGSLVLGLLELFVSHGQNRFYRELEEWISSITRLSFAGAEGSDGETSAVAEILDHMAEQMDQLQAMFTETQAASAQGAARLDALAGALNRLAQETAAEREDRQAQTQALRQIAGGQSRLIEALDALTERTEAAQNDDTDAEIRMRLRSIDGQLPRLLEEIAAGRQESMAEMRGGLAALTRALIGATPTREG
ncbi:biopolymer transporter ExbB [Paenirhodobacter enshiensis]|uniref:biopolymer transporter ExbB n=1 Tax=Paenirhodobacter enshiensis TaxID=1105367 RepID=UPI0035B32A63